MSPSGPTLEREQIHWDGGIRRLCALDEVGRGPMAGPVVAAAVILPVGIDPRLLKGVRDSKQLSPAQREYLARHIRALAVDVGVGGASVREIERLNIRRATALAMQRALNQMGPVEHILVDGLPVPELPGAQTAVIRGDSHCFTIACASVVAKVSRDRLMAQLAKRYPGYGWEHNSGYGTQYHLKALYECGLTPLHRRTWAPVRAYIASIKVEEG
ncbi:ribonuclease HII [Anthocerotibacter panamensis]|uniref:ribonuclease HII n=1 Tax=Anthocerotibacter panamensis TaxID=2857077 RepID=UPI001C406BA4|nr:ribonuclease HII [Anthocerotibacter panamensis]